MAERTSPRFSLHVRILLLVMGCVTLAMVAAVAVVLDTSADYEAEKRAFHRHARELADREAAALAGPLDRGDRAAIQASLERLTTEADVAGARLVLPGDRVLADAGPAGRRAGNGTPMVHRDVPGHPGAELVLLLSLQHFDRAWRQAAFKGAGVFLAVLLVSQLAVYLVFRRLAGPLQRLTHAMQALAEGDYSVPLPGAGRGDELGAMARALAVLKENSVLRRGSEQALRESEERLRCLLESLPDLVILFDEDAVYRDVLTGRKDLLVDDPERLLGRSVDAVLGDPDVAARIRAAIRDALEADALQAIEYRLQVRSGVRWFEARLVPFHLTIGGRRAVLFVSRDITRAKELEADLERRVAERTAELQHQHDFNQLLLRATPAFFVALDVDGRILMMNDALLGALGQTREEVEGRALAHSFVPLAERDRVSGLIRRVAVEGERICAELGLLVRGGEERLVEWRAVPVYREGPAPAYCFAVGMDITARKETEAALEHAKERAEEASRAKSNFLAAVSHEIRTPMNAITGYTRLLSRTGLDERQWHYVETVAASADELLALVDDVLDLSRIEARQLHLDEVAFDPREVVDNVIALLAPGAYEKGLEIIRQVDPQVPARIVGDPTRFRQIVVNLLGNAVRFTERGHAAVRIAAEPEGEERVRLHAAVTDTGPGLGTGDGAALFEPFVQGEPGGHAGDAGTGLGLAIARRLVETMGGSIGAENAPGGGARFWFTLAFRVERAEAPADPRLQGCPAVLYEPYEPAREGLAATLRDLGLAVAVTAGWDEALGRAAADGADGRALLVVGMDGGPEDTDRLRETAGLPESVAVVVLVRAFDQTVHMRYRELGAAVSLPKAASAKVLRRQLGHLWGGREPAPGRQEGATGTAGFAGSEVLVVDDSAVNRDLVCELLGQRGTACREAAGGAEAVAAVEEAVPDLVLMDIRMPEVDGMEATRRIRALDGPAARVPIVALTAYADTGDRSTYLEAGLNDVLVKPLQEEALWRALETWAGCRPQEPGTAEDPGARARRTDRLLGRFAHELAGQMPELRRAFEQGDWEALREHVHRVAGTAAACEVHTVAESARRLEQALRERHHDGVADRYQEFMAAAESIVEDLAAADPG